MTGESRWDNGKRRVKVLVIGAAGQLGYDLLRTFSPSHEVLGADMPGAGAEREIDIADQSSLVELAVAYQPDVVINAAAYTNVDGCETNRDACWQVNDTGAGNVARACGLCGGATLIHISTDYVFDGSKGAPYAENDPISPLGEYGKSKFSGEKAVRKQLPGKHLIVRTAWLFGVHGHNFVKTMLRLGRERDEISVVSDQTGSPTYAGHLAAALKSLAETRLGHPGTYHMTGSGHCTWYEFATEIFRLAGLPATLKPTTTAEYNAPAPRPAFSALANTRAPEIKMPPWRDGLIECLSELGELRNEGGTV